MLSLFSRLRRITSGATWIPEIDGLRFIAIFSVVMYHLSGQVKSKSGQVFTEAAWYHPITVLMGNGARGVELFFVISGFILGRPFARHFLLGEKPVALMGYYLRRLTRLEPPYVLCLLICAISIYIYFPSTVCDLTQHFLASAVYAHDFIYRSVSTLNGVTWTLEIEVQFYLLVPLLVLLYRIRTAWLRRTIFVATMLAFSAAEFWLFKQGLWDRPIGILYSTVFFYLQYFLAGLLLSDLYVTSMPDWPTSGWWDVVSLAGWPVAFYFYEWWPPAWLPLLLILLFIGAFRGVIFRRLFRVEAFALIGGMCYSLYLWHFFIISLVFKKSRYVVWTHDYLVNVILQSAILLPPVLLFSTLYYVWVERPCMDPRWPQKLMEKWKAARAGTREA